MLENVILGNLIYNEEYTRKVLPYLKVDYFNDYVHSIVFKLIKEYVEKYNRLPSIESLLIGLKDRPDIDEKEKSSSQDFIKQLNKSEDQEWLIDRTEQFCKDKAIFNAMNRGIEIMSDKSGKSPPRTIIPSLLEEALGVSFDTHIGHDFIDDVEERFEHYHAIYKSIPTDIDMFNKITKGGFRGKTLNILMGGVGFGKTQFMCHFAAKNLTDGRKVLYITLEMGQEEIAKRIDANLLDVSLDDIMGLSHQQYMTKHEHLKQKTLGKLIIKEYSEGTVGAAHFRHLLSELKLKKRFVPEIIYIDYLNLCCSTRVKLANVGIYEYVKMIAHEVRGLSKEIDTPIVSATQVNRDGFKSSDPGMENTSESWGLPAACDLLIVIIQSEELQKLGQVQVKQLKNRYSDYLIDNKFILGVHRDKMRLYNIEQRGQDNHHGPVFDNTTIGQKPQFKGFT